MGLLLAALFLLVLLAPYVAAQATPIDERATDTTLSEGRGTTPAGEVIADIWIKVIWVSAAIFILVMVLLLYALIRWRYKPGVKRDIPQVMGNSRLEIAWTIGPALIMIWLLVISYNGLFAIDDPDVNADVYVDVTAHSFFWEYEYSDGTSSSGGDSVLRVQEGVWVQLNVTSEDVHHAYKIAGLDVMIDAMPGRTNEVFFKANEPGVYLAQCMRFCGAGHGDMQSTVVVFAEGEQDQPFGEPRDEPEPEEPADPEDPPANGNETNDQNGENDNVTADVDRTIEVTLFDMFFDPAPLDLEPGETVMIRVANDGPSPHDLHIGDYSFADQRGEVHCDDPDDESTCWASEPFMDRGEEDSFIITAPDEPIAFDMWCSVPGHVGQGMISYLSVGGAEPENGAEEPRLPGPGVALLLAALGGLFVFLHRRR